MWFDPLEEQFFALNKIALDHRWPNSLARKVAQDEGAEYQFQLMKRRREAREDAEYVRNNRQ